LKVSPDGSAFKLTQRFNPGIKIPCESSAIHGILNKDLEGEPKFADFAPKLYSIFENADLGGFALRRLDIPILTKEFESAGLKFSMDGRRVVDASVIFREMERRNLSAAYKFYLGKELVGAHGAEADNDAAYAVFLAQLERYPQLPKDIQGLHDFCNAADPSCVDIEGKLVWRDGEAFFNFGKYRCKSLAEVCRTDPGYIDWIVQQGDFPKDFADICAKARRGVFPHPAPRNGGPPAH
ncbi:MAG: exodeoxyribonuclease X C-terminal domain-containing protein, partial [Elusimicrobiota bacterium]